MSQQQNHADRTQTAEDTARRTQSSSEPDLPRPGHGATEAPEDDEDEDEEPDLPRSSAAPESD